DDLARRLAGQFAGLTAAALAATSQLLAIYGTFGRMYSLFAFTSALALDLFVRAVDRPARGTLVAATAAALLPILVHPFGVFVFSAELAVTLWLWRVRALPAALLAAPLILPYLRLHGRYDPDVGMSAPEAALRALAGSTGGFGAGLAIFAVFAAIGAWTLPRRFADIERTLVAIPDGGSWKIVVVPGPFANVPKALARAAPRLHGIGRAAALQLYSASAAALERERP